MWVSNMIQHSFIWFHQVQHVPETPFKSAIRFEGAVKFRVMCFYISVIHQSFPSDFRGNLWVGLGLRVGIWLGINLQTGTLFRDQQDVDPAMRLTLQNQDVLICTSLSHCIVFYEVLSLNKAFNYLTKTFLRDIEWQLIFKCIKGTLICIKLCIFRNPVIFFEWSRFIPLFSPEMGEIRI